MYLLLAAGRRCNTQVALRHRATNPAQCVGFHVQKQKKCKKILQRGPKQYYKFIYLVISNLIFLHFTMYVGARTLDLFLCDCNIYIYIYVGGGGA
jgi:hypothetical protein